ncbi:hypothetical protein Q4601_09060 [Shewanella sp. 1_MG-2023]|uniref:hypothetical protein n=1 Tax=unclassified Shewanella TaxID=196818 RepID=UPI0026E18821|nr:MULTISPECIES: hypothetical protein [unclassified Shewanella]MDO6610442.1 hypothetical protein [Shewanella sp. 7_MG-2023]MDO6770567.1 hypothetical protein [Shewanella sp. 2_MG-2023]MDO6794454.1 hypothetical protein [Shewanella sp. 1_MG-2023]
MLITQIASPLNYLKIKSMNSKYLFDWLFPILLTSISCIYLYVVANWDLNFIIIQSGFIDKLLAFTALLPGFFIAALAAIATFPRKEIDFALDNPNVEPTMKVNYVDKSGVHHKEDIIISRRVFLCSLFSFVTFESIVLLLINLFSSVTVVPVDTFFVLTSFYVVLVLFIFWQMLTAAFLGLYYLSFRIHLLR